MDAPAFTLISAEDETVEHRWCTSAFLNICCHRGYLTHTVGGAVFWTVKIFVSLPLFQTLIPLIYLASDILHLPVRPFRIMWGMTNFTLVEQAHHCSPWRLCSSSELFEGIQCVGSFHFFCK